MLKNIYNEGQFTVPCHFIMLIISINLKLFIYQTRVAASIECTGMPFVLENVLEKCGFLKMVQYWRIYWIFFFKKDSKKI